MWVRADLKQRAKDVLRRNYWKAFVVSLVIAFAVGSNSGSSSGFNSAFRNNSDDSWSSYESDYYQEFEIYENPIASSIIALVTGAVVVVALIVSLLLKILLCYNLEVGGRKFFLQAATIGEDNMSYLGWGFKSGRYSKLIVPMFMRDLFIFLWSLLLIIPGIVKSYSYRMVPYILSDNPDIGYKRALELSKTMTNGHKLNMFVLDLSFLGWILLGFIACCIGVVFVNPYIDATNAELYLKLRQEAINASFTSESELNMTLQ